MLAHRSGTASRRAALVLGPLLVVGILQPVLTSASAAPATDSLRPTIERNVGFDVSPAARSLSREAPSGNGRSRHPDDLGAIPTSQAFTGDAAVQSTVTGADASATAVTSFQGLSNSDNAAGLVSPPDPVGDVGPNHYVQLVNLSFAIYSKAGTVLVPATPVGNLWSGFSIPDCSDNSGDGIVLYDQIADRWLITQFSTRGPTFYNCVAVSTTADPTGTYFRYAFSTGNKFPDYPKYGVWPKAYFISTREFSPTNAFTGVGAYALERNRMLAGNPNVRVVHFNLAPGTTPYLPGDGLLPSDFDGTILPPANAPNLYVGTQDDAGPYGAPSDALNIFAFSVTFGATPTGSFTQIATLPVPAFDSIFPCGGSGRACIAQPTVSQKIDILSYRQRALYRLAYRNFGDHESLVTNQSVEARPGIAGVRWYEIRNPAAPVLFQASTFAPTGSVNRWMGSIAQDRAGNMAVGYSVSNSSVFPGIRYTTRRAADPLDTMRTEVLLIAGSGSQTGSERWGDYSSMNIDPVDNCTFWYTNEYVATTGVVNWTTRIGHFRLTNC